MLQGSFSRRSFSAGIGAVAASLSAAGVVRADTSGAGEITRGHAAIHQEPVFAASAAQIYRVLTSADLFGRVVQLSGAMKSMKLGSAPAHIDARPGGAFALFGGYITGYNLELVPDTRLLQAWRSGSWEPGAYSIAKFVLSAHTGRTTIVFDHTGFPDGTAEHLAQGWHQNYWEPLAKVLSGQP